jgi:hypothetical protein
MEIDKFVYYTSNELPLCPRCNHRHRLLKKKVSEFAEDPKIIPMDKCPHCNCPLHYDLLEEEYVL